MANQIIVTQSGNVQVSIEPTPNVQVQISRAAIGTVSNVPTANFANYAANVTSSSQPNITSLGTLGNLSVSGNTTLNNLVVTGNLSAGNLIANSANYANFANVANTANSVALSNVSGAGNIASINLDGNVSNVLSGNGSFVPLPTVSANANYANFAGTAFNVSGSNVSGTVANATYAANAGNATIANSANSVALANVSGAGNIASINLDGNVSNVLSGNGSFVALPTVSANANYANFAGTAFNVSGSNVSGEVANAAYANAANTANLATYATTANSVAGANVSGTVANATFALNAGNSNLANTANSVALANVVGIGNIANINLDGSSSNVLYGNGQFATIAIPSGTSISNGTSNVNIPVANGNIVFGVGGNSDLVKITATGIINSIPTTTSLNSYVINSYDTGSDPKRIASFKYRGNITTPLSVQPNDTTMRLITLGHNGAALQTSSSASLKGVVDSSYTANGANIPIGWQIQVNDTNGGINNQQKTHNFYSNGYVAFANGGQYGGTTQDTVFKVLGNNNNGYAEFNGVSFRVFQDNANGAAGYSPFYFSTYQANNDPIPSSKYFRAAGTTSSPLAVSNGSNIALNQYAAYADSGNVYKPVFEQQVTVTSNDGVGNLTGNMNFYAYNTGSNINLQASNTYANIFTATYLKGDGSNITNVALGNIANLNIISSNTSLPTDQFNTTGIVVGSTSNANLQANSLQVVVDYGNGQGDSNSALTKGISYVKARGTSASPTTAVANDIIKRENYLGYNGTSNVLYATTTANATTINANANAVWGSGAYQINTGSTTGDLGNANALSAYNSFNFLSTGQLVIQPGANSTPANMLNIISYGQPTNLAQAQGVTFSKARGNRDANLSVNANDILGRLTFQGYNGSSFVTNRLPIIRGVVDSTYVANAANIPAGLQMIVCDSNTNYTHQFYANGATSLSGNLQATGGNFQVNKTTANAQTLYFGGDKTTNSNFDLYDAQFSVTMSNVNTTTGFSPFRFQQYAPTSSEFGPMYYYRSRGTDFFTSAPVVANDKVMSYNFIVNSNNVTTSIGQFDSTVTYNDNAGNVGMKFDFNALGQGTTGYLNGAINLLANTTNANNFNASNVSINTNGFMKLSSYTAANLTAITGSVGWMAAVSDSAGGSNPNGMIAFWDTTNSRWSYIHDNSAV